MIQMCNDSKWDAFEEKNNGNIKIEQNENPYKIEQSFEKPQIVGIQNMDEEQEQLDEEAEKRKNENKQRYRRLKQKLTALCCQHQQKCLIKDNKEVSSPNKSRLLTLAIQFEKLILQQTKDYISIQSKLRQIQRILDHKRQHDLLILKQSRFVPAMSNLLKKVPTFHKSEFNHSIKAVDLGLKLLRIFSTLSSNRDYLISTNQLVILNSCLNSFISKDEKKLALECLAVVHELMCSRIKAESEQIVLLSLQIVFIGQLARRIRISLENCVGQDGIQQPEYTLKTLKYLFIVYRKSFDRNLQSPIYDQQELPQYLQYHSDSLIFILTSMLPKILLDEDGELKDQYLPICIINICLYILKLLNLNLHANLVMGQKNIDLSSKSQFLNVLKILFQYSMDSMDEGEQLYQINCICSQIIELIGKISCFSEENKKILAQIGLLQKLYNHPVSYLMDQRLKSILVPSLCSTMDQCESNMKIYLTQSSADGIINYISLQKRLHEQILLKHQEEQSKQYPSESDGISQKNVKITHKTLNRKSSVSSMNSFTTECTQRSGIASYQQEKYTPRLINLLPFCRWEELIDNLKRLDN